MKQLRIVLVSLVLTMLFGTLESNGQGISSASSQRALIQSNHPVSSKKLNSNLHPKDLQTLQASNVASKQIKTNQSKASSEKPSSINDLCGTRIWNYLCMDIKDTVMVEGDTIHYLTENNPYYCGHSIDIKAGTGDSVEIYFNVYGNTEYSVAGKVDFDAGTVSIPNMQRVDFVTEKDTTTSGSGSKETTKITTTYYDLYLYNADDGESDITLTIRDDGSLYFKNWFAVVGNIKQDVTETSKGRTNTTEGEWQGLYLFEGYHYGTSAYILVPNGMHKMTSYYSGDHEVPIYMELSETKDSVFITNLFDWGMRRNYMTFEQIKDGAMTFPCQMVYDYKSETYGDHIYNLTAETNLTTIEGYGNEGLAYQHSLVWNYCLAYSDEGYVFDYTTYNKIYFTDETTFFGEYVSKPTITGNETFKESQTVTITAGEGCTIYYSYDGEKFEEYTKELTLTETTTVYAYAVDGDGNESDIVTAEYTLIDPKLVISPESKTVYYDSQDVTITAADGLTIYYSTDGENYQKYTGTITLTETTTIYAYTQDDNGIKSGIVTAEYKFEELSVYYTDESGAAAGPVVAIQLTSNVTTLGDGTLDNTKYYYVLEDLTISNRIKVDGNAMLILGDGAKLTASSGITVNADSILTITAGSISSEIEGTGSLYAVGGESGDVYNAGIGSTSQQNAGVITINGGNIEAACTESGTGYGAGIGGGNGKASNEWAADHGMGGTITINGGNVTAYCSKTGTSNTVAIGRGFYADLHGNDYSGTITINGNRAVVTAYGNKSIYASEATANPTDGGFVKIEYGTEPTNSTAYTSDKSVDLKSFVNGSEETLSLDNYQYAHIFFAADETPTITADPTSIEMSANVGESVQKTFTVKGTYLTSDLTLTLSDDNGVYSIDPSTISATDAANGVTVTVTYTRTADGTHSAEIVISGGGADDVTVTINGTTTGPVVETLTGDIVFDDVVDGVQAWSFTGNTEDVTNYYVVTDKDGNVVAEGEGLSVILPAAGTEDATYTVTVTITPNDTEAYTGEVTASTDVTVKGEEDEPTDVTYTVAGNLTDALGTSWDVTNTDNDMTLVDGIYTLTKTDVEMTAGTTLEFKVAKDHDWGTAYPSGNYTYDFTKSGIYTLVFTFNDETKEVGFTALTEEGEEVDPFTGEMYILGNVNDNDWDPSNGVNKMEYNSADDTFTLTDAKFSTAYESEYSYFSFTTKLGENSEDWSFGDYRFGATENGFEITEDLMDTQIDLVSGDNAFMVAPGIYDVTVYYSAKKVVLTYKGPIPANVDVLAGKIGFYNVEDGVQAWVFTGIDEYMTDDVTSNYVVTDKDGNIVAEGEGWSVVLPAAGTEDATYTVTVTITPNDTEAYTGEVTASTDVTVEGETPEEPDYTQGAWIVINDEFFALTDNGNSSYGYTWNAENKGDKVYFVIEGIAYKAGEEDFNVANGVTYTTVADGEGVYVINATGSTAASVNVGQDGTVLVSFTYTAIKEILAGDIVFNDVADGVQAWLFDGNTEDVTSTYTVTDAQGNVVAQGEGWSVILPAAGTEDATYTVTVTVTPNDTEAYSGEVTASTNVTVERVPRSFTLHVSEASIATMYIDFPVEIVYDQNVHSVTYAYEVSGKNLRTYRLNKYIPANFGVIVQTGKEMDVTFNEVTAETAAEEIYSPENLGCENMLRGVLETTDVSDLGEDGSTIYTLGYGTSSIIGFYKYTGTSIRANSCYLPFDSSTSADINALNIVIDNDDATDINDIETIGNEKTGDNVVYDLTGRKVNRPSKGIYIVNGKKVLLK